MIRHIDLTKQYLLIQKEVDFVIKQIIQNHQFINGKPVEDFEKKFAKYLNVKYCLGVASGSDALEIAVRSLNLERNSEIIIPVNSYIAVAEAIINAGYKPIFCDCNINDFNLSANDLEQKITKKTKAIIVVHLYGAPADLDKIIKIAKKTNLKIIEDCAQSHGAKYKKKKVGSFGDLSIFSFFPGKNLGAYGDGGAIVSNKKTLIDKCRLIANHGQKNKNQHIIIGRNSRLDGIQAAILSVKLKYLNHWNKKRQLLARQYFKNLADIKEITLLKTYRNRVSVFHQFTIQAKKRNQLKKYLEDKNIETTVHYPKIIVDQPVFKNYKKQQKYLARDIAKTILNLPIGEHLEKKDINKVCQEIKRFYSKNLS